MTPRAKHRQARSFTPRGDGQTPSLLAFLPVPRAKPRTGNKMRPGPGLKAKGRLEHPIPVLLSKPRAWAESACAMERSSLC